MSGPPVSTAHTKQTQKGGTEGTNVSKSPSAETASMAVLLGLLALLNSLLDREAAVPPRRGRGSPQVEN